MEDRHSTLSRISCSMYNSAAIAYNDKLYVWGSVQSGIVGVGRTKAQELPMEISFDKINSHLKPIHVSLSSNHIAVLTENSLLNNVQTVRNIHSSIREVLDKHAKIIKDKKIDVLRIFEINTNPCYLKKPQFRVKLAQYDPHFTAGKDKLAEKEKEDFINYFTTKNETEVDVIQYVYDLKLSINIMASNQVVTWGFEANGKLGQGQPQEEETSGNVYKPPQVVFIPKDIRKVLCGAKFTIAADFDGNIWTWGKGSNGCLGTGQLKDAWTPQQIDADCFDGDVVIDIAAGAEHCLALTKKLQVYSWGNGSLGRLGHGSEQAEMRPKRIAYFVKEDLKVLSVSAGEAHSAVISEKYEVYTWGCGEYFRLGHGSKTNEMIPKKIEAIDEEYIHKISCGAAHTMCITHDGFMYAWGCGANGRLGVDFVSEEDYLLPKRVGATEPVFKKKVFTEVFAGPSQTFAVGQRGDLYAWGSQKFKSLGFAGLEKDLFVPDIVKVKADKHNLDNLVCKIIKPKDEEESNKTLSDEEGNRQSESNLKDGREKFAVSQLFCGEANTVFLMKSGHVFITGSGHYGQLCIDPEKDNLKDYMSRVYKKEKSDKKDQNLFWEDELLYSYSPIFITVKNNVLFKHMAVGLHHIIAISKDGQAYSWGKNTEGQLGIGSQAKFLCQPTLIEEISSKKFRMVVASHTYSAFLAKSGEVFVCGTAEYGCLGVNEIKQHYEVLIPKMINDLDHIKYIAGGPQHMVAINDKSELYVWGNTNNGRIGVVGKNEKAYVPRKVKVDTKDLNVKFKMATCGSLHTLLLDTAGYIWGVGVKAFAGFPSKNGYRSLEEQETFERLPDLYGECFDQISSGEFHNLALHRNEEVYGWGKSELGKLAQDTFMDYDTAADERHTNKKDDLDIQKRLKNILLPKKIADIRNAKQVSCGVNHSMCLNRDGEIYVWGCVLTGRLGIRNDNLKLLKHQQLIKTDHNLMSLNTPKPLRTHFDEEYYAKIHDEGSQAELDGEEGSYEDYGQDRSSVSPRPSMGIKGRASISPSRPNMSANDSVGDLPNTKKKQLDRNFTNVNPAAAGRMTFPTSKFSEINSGGEVDYLGNTRASTDALSRKNDSPGANNVLKNALLSNKLSSVVGKVKATGTAVKALSPTQDRSRTSIKAGTRMSASPSPDVSEDEARARRETRGGTGRQLTTMTAQSNSPSRKSKKKNNDNDSQSPGKYYQLDEEKVKALKKLKTLLQDEEDDHREAALLARDLEVTYALNEVLRKSSEQADKIHSSMNNRMMEAQGVIETSIALMPKQPRMISGLVHNIPSFILQNIQVYEAIISTFYVHPCYLKKILKSELIDPNIAVDWIFKIYSSYKEDKRAINQVLALALMVLEEEVKVYPISQLSVVKLMGSFVKLYDFIFENQPENKNFIREIAEYLIKDVLIEGYLENDELESEDKRNIGDLFNIEQFQKYGQSDERRASIFYNRCFDFLTRMERHIITILSRPDFSVMGKMSMHMRYFHAQILKEYGNSSKGGTASSKKAQLFVIELFFSKIAKVIVDFENHDIKIPSHQKKILTKQNLNGISTLIVKFFAREDVAPRLTRLNDFMNCHSKGSDTYNNMIKGMTGYDDFDLTLDNITLSLRDSLSIGDKFNCKLSVKDIIMMQNFLIKNKDNPKIFLIKNETRLDPIKVMIEAIKDNWLEVNSFPFEMLEYKVNLKIDNKIIRKAPGAEEAEFHRCNQCQLLLPTYLLSTDDAQYSKQETWKCTCHGGDLSGNNFEHITCRYCDQIVRRFINQKRFVFERYLPLLRKEDRLQTYIRILKDNEFNPTKEHIITFLENKEKMLQADDKKFPQSIEIRRVIKYFNEFITPDKPPALNLSPLMKYNDKFRQNNSVAPEYQDAEQLKSTEVVDIIDFVNDLLLEEYKMRDFHKKYLDLLDSTLNTANQILKETMVHFNKIDSSMQTSSIRIVLTRARNNGIVSFAFKKPSALEEEDLRRKFESNQQHPYSMVDSNDLKIQKVLTSFVLNGKVVPKIVNNLKFYVFYKKETGFSIKVVFLEDSWQNIIVQLGYCYFKEVTLGEINITPEHFLELMRTINYKSETTLGYATFNVERLVKLLNGILIKSYARKAVRIGKKA